MAHDEKQPSGVVHDGHVPEGAGVTDTGVSTAGRVLTGIGVSPGLRIGPVRTMTAASPAGTDHSGTDHSGTDHSGDGRSGDGRVSGEGTAGAEHRAVEPPGVEPPEAGRRDVEAERLGALGALDAVADELRARGAAAAAAGNDEARDVLEAQALMATDPVLAQDIAARTSAGATAERAVSEAFGVHRELLARAGGYLAGRVADLDDIRDRAVARLLGRELPRVPDSDRPFVLVAGDLAPAETAVLDPAKIIAFVTEEGGPTSHSAILARAMGIPAVVACRGCTAITDGTLVVVDGGTGKITVDPDERELAAARQAEAAARRAAADAPSGPGRTADGHPVPLLANIGGPRDVDAAVAHGAEGVGLYRTEFLFLDRPDAPGTGEQAAAYRRVFDAFPKGRVVVRLLDAGADKPLGFLPPSDHEPNPALGERGLRMLRRHPDVLDAQLAALGAAAAGAETRVEVMAPMVTDLDDVAFFTEACRRHGIRHAGIMIEVPAAALRAGELAREVEFVSIGTNDLVQYTFAADRQASGLARLQDPWQPALLDLLALVGTGAAAAGSGCGVCGEAAADPVLACVLVGLGATSLSMSAPALAAVRAALAAHTLDQCRAAAAAARSATEPAAARAAARSHLPSLP